ncbi:hypothetical protein KJ840_04195, partial [Patescibacteria group bacterium]|nr:hypothetical protein [Patescibacteria group bacterium]
VVRKSLRSFRTTGGGCAALVLQSLRDFAQQRLSKIFVGNFVASKNFGSAAARYTQFKKYFSFNFLIF